MPRLFLASSFADSAALLAACIAQADLPPKLLFIPTAARVESYRGFIDDTYRRFAELGLAADVMDIAETSAEDAQKRIESAAVLATSGGNTFYLLQELRRKNLPELIRTRVAQGMLYAGESAGAMIAAHTIDYAAIMDDRGLAPELPDTTALGLVDFAPVPHFGEPPFEEAAANIVARYQHELKLLPINNRQAVIVTGEQYEIRTAECAAA